jgi:hypothetical protein
MADKSKPQASETEATEAGAVELEEGALDKASGGLNFTLDKKVATTTVTGVENPTTSFSKTV